jgi:hypothetical protein
MKMGVLGAQNVPHQPVAGYGEDRIVELGILPGKIGVSQLLIGAIVGSHDSRQLLQCFEAGLIDARGCLGGCFRLQHQPKFIELVKMVAAHLRCRPITYQMRALYQPLPF